MHPKKRRSLLWIIMTLGIVSSLALAGVAVAQRGVPATEPGGLPDGAPFTASDGEPDGPGAQPVTLQSSWKMTESGQQ